MRPFLFILSVTGFLLLTACSRQGLAYKESPVCKQAKTVCAQYKKTLKQADGKSGAGIDQLREDCEGSQRACAESVQNLQGTPYPDDRQSRDPLYR